MKIRRPAFQFYPTDWLAGTILLTPAQKGAFIDLLCYAWLEEDCGLPSDEAKLSILSGLRGTWRSQGNAILEKFDLKGNRLFNRKLLEIREASDAWHQKSVEGGKNSAAKRQAKSNHPSNLVVTNNKPDPPNGTNSSSSSSSSSETLSQNLKPFDQPTPLVDPDTPPFDSPELGFDLEPDPPKVDAKEDKIPALFDQWWAIYWRHEAKKPALKAFRKHCLSPRRFKTIMAATEAQKPKMLSREPESRPQGATWLNGERWEDPLHDVPVNGTGQSAESIQTQASKREAERIFRENDERRKQIERERAES